LTVWGRGHPQAGVGISLAEFRIYINLREITGKTLKSIENYIDSKIFRRDTKIARRGNLSPLFDRAGKEVRRVYELSTSHGHNSIVGFRSSRMSP
jgi:hypothetical protein